MLTFHQLIANIAIILYGTTSIFSPLTENTHRQLFLAEDSAYYSVVDCEFVDGVCVCGNEKPRVTVSATYTPKAAPTCMTYYEMIPANIRTAFESIGGTVCKSPTQIVLDAFPGASVLGYINYEEMTIYIDSRDSANSSVVHEMGHWMDNYNTLGYLTLSDSEEWLNLYNTYWTDWYSKCGGSISNYNVPDEGFAECFQIYILKPYILTDDVRTYFDRIITTY